MVSYIPLVSKMPHLAAILWSCPQPQTAGQSAISTRAGAGSHEIPAARPQLILLSGGKLRLLPADGALRVLSARGSAKVPVADYDVSTTNNEAAIAHSGAVGVVPLTPPPGASTEGTAEEWYDLRPLAGEDFYASLVRISPDSRRMLAAGYQAGSVGEGFRLLSVNRDTGKATEVKISPAERRLLLGDIRFSPGGSAYLRLADETVPTDLVYGIREDRIELLFDSDKILGEGTGEGFEATEEDSAPLLALSLADFFPRGENIFLVVYLFTAAEGKTAEEELTARHEVWQFNSESRSVTRRYKLANAQPEADFDSYFELADEVLYFARLRLPQEEEPDELPKFTLMSLDLGSGEAGSLCEYEPGPSFYGLSLFPSMSACAVLLGEEDSLSVDGITLAGERFLTAVSVEKPKVFFLPAQ